MATTFFTLIYKEWWCQNNVLYKSGSVPILPSQYKVTPMNTKYTQLCTTAS